MRYADIPMPTRRRPPLPVLLLFLLVSLLVQTGCASVEHIRLYRDARAEFQDAARMDNIATLERAFPDAATVQAPNRAGAAPFDLDAARQSYERWHQIHAELSARASRAQRELSADRLYGATRALEIRARARRDFYAHVLSVGGAAPGPGRIPPLTVSVQEANALLARKDVELFPRDEYVLRSLQPTVRYEIAYLNALRLGPRAPLEALDDILRQMATAEQELADPPSAYPEHVLPHATMSRLVMLTSARALLQERANVMTPVPAADPRVAQHPGLKLLGERVAAFRARALDGRSPESRLFSALGLEATAQNLTTWGLGDVVK
jgi:hypothetical protein